MQDKINLDSEKIMEIAEFRIDGYIEGIMAPDGEEQDAYILGVNQPVEEFTGKIIDIIHRFNDVEENTKKRLIHILIID